MVEHRTSIGIEQRRDERRPIDTGVTIEVPPAVLVGAGENISAAGIFFTASAALPVTVRLDGHDATLRGELVRCENLGDGRFGIAIRFLDPLPEGIPPA